MPRSSSDRPNMSKIGKRSRQKGHKFERRVAQIFRKYFPEVEIRRGLQSRGGGKEVADVVGIPGIHVEAKCGKRPNPKEAWKQALSDKDDKEEALVVIHWDRGPTVAMVDLEFFLELLKERLS